MLRRRSSGASIAGGAVVIAVVVAAVVVVLGVRSDGPPPEDSVDVGFLRDMADHHEQAVRMSLLVIPAEGVSPAVRDVAVGVIASQRHDLGRIDAWLDDWSVERGAPGRPAMVWMGHHGMTVAGMPGMVSPADLAGLAAASGADADGRFLDLMIEHHRAGVEMASYAADHARTSKVVRLAELIEAGQQEEIRELASLRRQLETVGTLELGRASGG